MQAATPFFAHEQEHKAFSDALAGLDLDLGGIEARENAGFLGLGKKTLTSTLYEGANNDEVKTAQQKLATLGYAVPTSGVYGATTTQAVRQFQTSQDLPVTGNINQQTWDLLLKKAGGISTAQTFTNIFSAVGTGLTAYTAKPAAELPYVPPPPVAPPATNWLLIGGVAVGSVALLGGLVWLAKSR